MQRGPVEPPLLTLQPKSHLGEKVIGHLNMLTPAHVTQCSEAAAEHSQVLSSQGEAPYKAPHLQPLLRRTGNSSHTCPLWDHGRSPAVLAVLEQVGQPLAQGSSAGLDGHPTVSLASPAGTNVSGVLSHTASCRTALLHIHVMHSM